MKTVVQKIRKNALLYLALILVFILFWNWIFGILTQVKPEEKVSVFIGSYSQGFDQWEELNNSRPAYLKTVETQCYAPDIFYFGAYLTAFGYGEADIIILPESKVAIEESRGHYSEISERYQSEFANLGFYEYEGKTYGIRIHDKETHESLISCLDYGEGEKEENYYLFFNKQSMHISNLADENKKNEMEGAIDIARKLLAL